VRNDPRLVQLATDSAPSLAKDQASRVGWWAMDQARRTAHDRCSAAQTTAALSSRVLPAERDGRSLLGLLEPSTLHSLFHLQMGAGSNDAWC